MTAPRTSHPNGWPSHRGGRPLDRLGHLLAVLAALLTMSTSAADAAWQRTSTTVPGETSTSASVGGPAGVGIEVVPRVVDLVFRTTKLTGGKDTATVSEAPGSTEVALAADVLFAFDSARLSAAAQAELAETAQLVRERAKGVVRVEGHTDAVGSPSYNLDLSQRRGEAVHDALATLLGDRPTEFSVRGFGARRPVAANRNPDGSDNPKGRAKNRRVTVAFST